MDTTRANVAGLDFTPVATTELVTFTQLQVEFAKRGVKLFALSTNNTLNKDGFESHKTWVKDIDELSQTPLLFPIISDSDGTIFRLFNLLVYSVSTWNLAKIFL